MIKATLTTARRLSDAELEKITARFTEILGDAPDFTVILDPSLIGGFVLRFDDLLVDASLARQLDTLRRGFGNKQNRIV